MMEFDEAMRLTTELQEKLFMNGVESRFMIPGEGPPYLVMEEEHKPPVFLQVRGESETIRSVLLFSESAPGIKARGKSFPDGIVTHFQWEPEERKWQAFASLPFTGYAPDTKAMLLFWDLFCKEKEQMPKGKIL